MDFHKACKEYLEGKGYKYLGDENGMVFYELPNGKVQGASESSVAENMNQKIIRDSFKNI